MKRAWLLVVLGWPIGSQAFFETGSGLIESCDGDMIAYSRCVGFLQGVSDTIKTLEARGQRAGVCAPSGTTSKRLERIFRDYAGRNPHKLGVAASTLAVDAFREAWRCKGGR